MTTFDLSQANSKPQRGFGFMYLFSFPPSRSITILFLLAAQLPIPGCCVVHLRQWRCCWLHWKEKRPTDQQQEQSAGDGWVPEPFPFRVQNLWLPFAVLKLESNTIMTVPIYFYPIFYFYLYRKLILILSYWCTACNYEKRLLLGYCYRLLL